MFFTHFNPLFITFFDKFPSFSFTFNPFPSFFFEKNIHQYFLAILNSSPRTSPHITVQLLQTLSILFENIRTETSIYYLLSNNYVNSIIVHKYDFSDEEILAYYISFLKTLSLKLNKYVLGNIWESYGIIVSNIMILYVW